MEASLHRTAREKKTSRRKILLVAPGLLLLGAAAYLAARFGSGYISLFSNPARIKEVILGAGPAAPLAYVALQALQVIIAPLPGQVTSVVGGYLFGTARGIVLSTIGITLGSLAAFYLARLAGRPLVERWLGEKSLRRADEFVKRRGTITIFLVFLLPFLPDDAVCFAVGLTPIRPLIFTEMVVLGRLPGIIAASLVGSSTEHLTVYATNWLFWLLLVTAAVAVLVAYLFRRRIEDFFRHAALHIFRKK
ncbi:MAG: TVP38/TMEM64 family protein [Firmicutes bacterium]|nr:TVP38/TMEM64 family protein [Bacillota bacterium]